MYNNSKLWSTNTNNWKRWLTNKKPHKPRCTTYVRCIGIEKRHFIRTRSILFCIDLAATHAKHLGHRLNHDRGIMLSITFKNSNKTTRREESPPLCILRNYHSQLFTAVKKNVATFNTSWDFSIKPLPRNFLSICIYLLSWFLLSFSFKLFNFRFWYTISCCYKLA